MRAQLSFLADAGGCSDGFLLGFSFLYFYK